MMEAKKHSPLPWGYFVRNQNPGYGLIDINQLYDGDKDGIDVATIYPSTDNAEDNAAFIVHACNNIERVEKERDALLAALRGYDAMALIIESAVRNADPSWNASILHAIKNGTEAIASVEGGVK